MQVIGARITHRVQIELLQNVECLQQHRALAAETLLVNRVASIGRARRLLNSREVLGKVGFVERRVVLAQERDHLARDVALVETIARRVDAGDAPARFRGAFGLDHAAQVLAVAGSLIVSPGL